MYLTKFSLIAGVQMLAQNCWAADNLIDLRNWDTWAQVAEDGITLREGETTDMILFENRSLGYEWTQDTSGSNEVYSVEAVRSTPTRGFGAPGTLTYTFEPTKAGEGIFRVWQNDRTGNRTWERATTDGQGSLLEIEVRSLCQSDAEIVELTFDRMRELSESGYSLEPNGSVVFDLYENATTGFRWLTDESVSNDLFTVSEESYYTGRAPGSGGRKQFRLDAGSAQGQGIFYACETRERSIQYGVLSGNTNGCAEIPIRVQRSMDLQLLEFDLRNPDTVVGDLTLSVGQQVKLTTATNPSVWGRYDIDTSGAGDLVEVHYQYTTSESSDVMALLGASGGVDEWTLTAVEQGSGTVRLVPSFSRPGWWQELHLPFEINFTVQ